MGSVSFLIAELIGMVIIGILADQYGRKLMLLMCLYIPVVCTKNNISFLKFFFFKLFGSLAAFTTTYSLFIILRWPVGFFNKVRILFNATNKTKFK
jgi:MFS family permease